MAMLRTAFAFALFAVASATQWRLAVSAHLELEAPSGGSSPPESGGLARRPPRFRRRATAAVAPPAGPRLLLAGKPPRFDEDILPVQKLFDDLIKRVQRQLEAGISEDRFLWCDDVKAKTNAVAEKWADAKVEPHAWALKQVRTEIEWLCDDWQPERRREFGSHAEMLRDIVETYKEEMQCKPGMAPCHEGVVSGIRPHCHCVCHQWWNGTSCNVPMCRPLTKQDFPFTDCGTEDDGCGGTVEFGSCAKELQLSDVYKSGAIPAGISKELEPVAQMMVEMLRMARESLKYGGASDEKTVFCQDVERQRKSIRVKFKYYDAQPHKWALDQAVKEIEWLCRTDRGASREELREQLEDHRKNLQEMLVAYKEMVVCEPGMAHCDHGRVVGIRPACMCDCDKGWKGERCDVRSA